MNHPKVYDAKRRVLDLGSRVSYGESSVPFGDAICGFPWRPDEGWVVEVAMHGVGSGSHFVPTTPDSEPNTYRCPDLLLITDDEKGSSDD